LRAAEMIQTRKRTSSRKLRMSRCFHNFEEAQGSGVRISSGAPFANYAIAAKIGRFFD
jgi:hypothetical protein